MFDGNLGTFFDALMANSDRVGLDLGTAKVVASVKFAPRAGHANRMLGGQIQASNTASFSSGVVTLGTISTAPAAGTLPTLSLGDTAAYRFFTATCHRTAVTATLQH